MNKPMKMRETSRGWDKKPIDNNNLEYQIETLRLYGKNHPESGLEKKVKGWHFSQNIDIIDPVTKFPDKKPLKHFMIDQLSILLDRDRVMLSPYDTLLYRQLINYNVVRITQTGSPIFTSVDEHALDALMLSILAFVMEMPNIAETIKKPQRILEISTSNMNPVSMAAQELFKRVNTAISTYKNSGYNGDNKCDRPPNVIMRNGNEHVNTGNSWAGRGKSGKQIKRSSF